MNFKKVIQISIFIMIVGIFGIFDLQKTKAAECGGDVVCACGDTVIASTTLTSDLDCSAGGVDGLIVGADGITIDGNNHTITGNISSMGINNNSSYNNIIIQNFKNIINFDYGIYLNNSNYITLKNNIISSNNTGIRIYNSHFITINNNFTNFNFGVGIFIDNRSDLSQEITLTNNVSNNNHSGIAIINSASSTISNNITNYNAYDGIIINNGDDVKLLNNMTSFNYENGIKLTNVINGILTQNTSKHNSFGMYLNESESIITENTLLYNNNDVYDDGENAYLNNNIYYNTFNRMLNFTNINREFNVNEVITTTASMLNITNGNSCEDCIYSITTNPIENILNIEEENIITSNFIVTKSGLYSITYKITDSNNNLTKKNFLFFVGEKNTTTSRYFLRDADTTHGQPYGNGGGDARALLLTPPLDVEEWMCVAWVQNSIDEIPEFPIAYISSIDIGTWYTSRQDGYLGIQKFVIYDDAVDLSDTVSSSLNYVWTNKSFNNLNWAMDDIKNWYEATFKFYGNIPILQTTPSQPSYVDFTYQYTTTPAIKSISNENIIVLSATAPANATSSASIVLDNPNTSATSTALVLTDFKRPFLGATSIIDSTSTTTLTTTIGASSSSTLDAVAMDIVPSYGSVSISIDTWNTTGTYYKKWSEEGSGHDISTSHTIGDLPPNTNYVIKVNGISYAGSKSNSSGQITFTYDDGYSTKTFELIEDTTLPVITILGSDPVSIYIGDNYTDSGAIALDNVDGDITNSIVVTNTVNTSIVGSYTVTYNVSDTASNPATQVVRVVNVLNRPGGGVPVYMLNIMNQQNQSNQITTNQTTENNNINQTTIKDNQIFKYYNDNKVYLLENGLKRWIKDEESFNKLGYKWSDIEVIDDNTITYPNGIDLEVIKPVFAFTKILKLRSFGSDVIQLQTILKRLGYFTYPRITNFFGSYTYNAVIKFQKANKLKATGIVDKATMNKLNSLLVY